MNAPWHDCLTARKTAALPPAPKRMPTWMDALLPAEQHPAATARRSSRERPASRQEQRAALVSYFVENTGIDPAEAEVFAVLALRVFAGETIYFPRDLAALRLERDRQIVAATKAWLSLRKTAKRYGLSLTHTQRIAIKGCSVFLGETEHPLRDDAGHVEARPPMP